MYEDKPPQEFEVRQLQKNLVISILSFLFFFACQYRDTSQREEPSTTQLTPDQNQLKLTDQPQSSLGAEQKFHVDDYVEAFTHPRPEIQAALVRNQQRKNDPAAISMLARGSGYTEAQVRLMLFGDSGRVRIPLGMSRADFKDLSSEMIKLVAEYPVLKSTIIEVQGTGATGWSTNPKKPNHFFDANGRGTSDYDIVFKGGLVNSIVQGIPESLPGWIGGRAFREIKFRPAGAAKTLGERVDSLREKLMEKFHGREINFGVATRPSMDIPGGIILYRGEP